MPYRYCSLQAFRIFTIALALTAGTTNVAVAKVFRCASGDVFCLIASIRSANERRGPDKIILEGGTYKLTAIDNTADSGNSSGNGLPSIVSRLTIEGAGATDTIIEGTVGIRVLHVADTGDLTLHGVTIQGGRTSFAEGGGIFNRGTLTVAHSVIRDNIAFHAFGGGIRNLRRLRVVDSRITNNSAEDLGIGGGILSAGSLEILRSTIDSNFADVVGGISAGGVITIEDSTISGNFAFAAGGLALDGTTTIANTTIAQNSSNSNVGGLVIFGMARLTNVTVADNQISLIDPELGGAAGVVIGSGSTVELQNTILARNTLLLFGSKDCQGTITSLGNNVIGDPAGCTVDLLPSDHVGDAGLGVFVDDGTPGRGHIPLLPDSPAIDAGNRRACPHRDQLDHRRVDGDGWRGVICDIGSVEFIP